MVANSEGADVGYLAPNPVTANTDLSEVGGHTRWWISVGRISLVSGVAEFQPVPAGEGEKKTHPPTLPFLRHPDWRVEEGKTPPPPYYYRFFA
jgi:hypothetical protein